MFLDAALTAGKGLLEWGPWVCLGLILLLDLARRQGESLTAYFKRPQAFAATLLATAAVAGFGRGFYILLTH